MWGIHWCVTHINYAKIYTFIGISHLFLLCMNAIFYVQYIPSEWKDVNQREFVPLAGYENTKQMLFASIFPSDTNDLDRLYTSVDKLCLTDSSVSALRDQSATSLGSGMRCGFLGFLHMEVFLQV